MFWVEIPFLGKFGPKSQNFHFKLKFGTSSNSNMQNSMLMFILSVFDWKYPFAANLAQKFKIISWSRNLVARLIWICGIQWYCSLFVLEWKYPFWANLVQKIKSVILSWYLVPTPIRICRILWCCPFFCFLLEKPFLGKFGPKNQNYQLKPKFGS